MHCEYPERKTYTYCCPVFRSRGEKSLLIHADSAWSKTLIGLWTNWMIPAYLLHQPSVVHSSAQQEESLGSPRSIHL